MANCSSQSNFTPEEARAYSIISGVTLGLSGLTCLAAVVLIVVGNLHRNLVYRLALYQVLSTLTFSALWVAYLALRDLEIAFLRSALAVLSGCSVMASLTTSTWMLVHLFALSVAHRNLDKLEPLYAASSVLFPLVGAAIVYGTIYAAISEDPNCPNLRATDAEWAAGYAVGGALLALDCALVSVMGGVLCFRAFRRTQRVFTQPDPRDRAVCVEMVPLLVYPVLLTVTFTMVLLDLIVRHTIDYVFVSFVSCLSIVNPPALLVHVIIVLWHKRRLRRAPADTVSVYSYSSGVIVVIGETSSLLENIVSDKSETDPSPSSPPCELPAGGAAKTV